DDSTSTGLEDGKVGQEAGGVQPTGAAACRILRHGQGTAKRRLLGRIFAGPILAGPRPGTERTEIQPLEVSCMRRTIATAIFAAALLVAPGAARLAAAQTSAGDSDSALRQRIERRIKADAGLKRQEVNVSVSDGVATLSGTVATPAQRQRAARLARVRGVTRVDNRLAVRSSAKTTTGG